MKFIYYLTILLVICSPIIALADAVSWSNAICKVVAKNGSGSGVLFDATNGVGLVATNQHVVGSDRFATTNWSDGWKSKGPIIWHDRRADLAIIQCSVPINSVILPIASKDEMPRSGDIVQLAGYGINRTTRNPALTIWNAKVNGYLQKPRDDDQIDVATNAISGDSGGAIIYQNKLAAVMWGGPTAGVRGPMTSVRGCVGNFITNSL